MVTIEVLDSIFENYGLYFCSLSSFALLQPEVILLHRQSILGFVIAVEIAFAVAIELELPGCRIISIDHISLSPDNRCTYYWY